MGRAKAGLRLEGRSLLQHARAAAGKAPWPTRVLRRDLVGRCGPLGGVYTALKTTRYEAVLFLACDMPFVTVALMEKLVRRSGGKGLAVFTRSAEGPGFPFLLRRSALGRVERQLARGQFSLRALAKACRARMVASGGARTVFNVNTPEEWERARAMARKTLSDYRLHGGD